MRPSWHDYFLTIAEEVSKMSTCARRRVGCVLVDKKNRILATGFNGVPPGWPHCNEGYPCPGAAAESGSNLDECYANHAEANALLQCQDVWRIENVYVTTSPCISCVKLLLCTSAKMIVFEKSYADEEKSAELWLRYSEERAWAKIGRL